MQIIAPVDFSDLGYRRLEPSLTFGVREVDRLAEFAKLRARFDVECAGDARWLRHRDRKSGPISPLLRELAAVHAHTGDLEHALAPLSARDRAWDDLEGRYGASVETCIKLCQPTPGEPLHRLMHFLTSAASLVTRDELVFLLARHVLPAFFTLFPKGCFLAHEVSFQLETRLGLCRSLHRYSQYAVSTFTPDDSPPLQKLHSQSSYETPAILVDLLSALTYPWVTTVSTIRSGLLFVFVLDPAPTHVEPFFPASWGAKLRGGAEVARAPVDLHRVIADQDPKYRKTTSLRRHLLAAAPSSYETLALLRYSIERFSNTLWHSTDPSEYCAPGSPVIDPLGPFEFGLTLDRVLRKGVLAVFGSSEGDRKDDCFEIADLLEELWKQRQGAPGNASYFKGLFDRTKALALLDRCVAAAPVGNWAPIVPAVRAAYDRLVEGIADSVVISSKKTHEGVLVRNRKLEQEALEPFETFAANVVRALRNAHHGYLTAHDPQNRPLRYLSLVSGHLPEEVSLLASFWVWAALTHPEIMFDRPWMRVGGYEA